MERIDSQGDFDAIRQAAERGYAEAQLYLGSMYANGLGVPQDDAEAVRWFRLAAERARIRQRRSRTVQTWDHVQGFRARVHMVHHRRHQWEREG